MINKNIVATCKTEQLFLYGPIKSETYSLHMTSTNHANTV